MLLVGFIYMFSYWMEQNTVVDPHLVITVQKKVRSVSYVKRAEAPEPQRAIGSTHIPLADEGHLCPTLGLRQEKWGGCPNSWRDPRVIQGCWMVYIGKSSYKIWMMVPGVPPMTQESSEL